MGGWNRKRTVSTFAWVLAAAWLLSACGSSEQTQSFITVRCKTSAECDNGLACDGAEQCVDNVCVLGPPIVCDDEIACTTDVCSDELGRCIHTPRDADGDGHGDLSCVDAAGMALGDDCDDTDATRFPGNTELCDATGHDEDCDPTTFGYVDADGDGFPASRCCNGDACGDDCDDVRQEVRPDAQEICDKVDNNCNGLVDEGVSLTLYEDLDGDGFGNPSAPVAACQNAPRTSSRPTDCDDTDPARHPSQLEICDSIDNDCDVKIDEAATAVLWYPDADGDGFGDANGVTVESCAPVLNHVLLPTDCDDTAPDIHPVAQELCDGKDNDCNGAADFLIGPNDFEDDDGDGLVDSQCVPVGTDCDDHDALSGAGQSEQCDGRDNDCDGTVDEAVEVTAWFLDLDGDGYGAASSGVRLSCRAEPGYSALGGDCNDGDVLRFPGAGESCNETDDDCDGTVDEGFALVSDLHCGACNATCGGGTHCEDGACIDNSLDGYGVPVQVAVGADFTCVLDHYGDVYCFGGNSAGQLADGSVSPRHVPMRVEGVKDAVLIRAGYTHVCAVTDSGERKLLCWGSNIWGQAGAPLETGVLLAPVEVPLVPVVHPFGLALGFDHSCAIDASGVLSCWGDNWQGALGLGTVVDEKDPTPAPTSLLGMPSKVTAGTGFSCAETEAGIHCWGVNDDGQRGDGAGLPGTDGGTPVPLAVAGGADMLQSGQSHACRSLAGTIECWGADDNLELGNDASAAPSSTPVIAAATGATELVTLASHSCARFADGTATCWGANGQGELGSGAAGAASHVPLSVQMPVPLRSLALGSFAQHTCGIGTDDVVYCWGANSVGQLGRDPALVTNSATPTAVENP